MVNTTAMNMDVQHAEVVEYASGMARDMMGELVENVASGLDTYSIRQPLGVRSPFSPHPSRPSLFLSHPAVLPAHHLMPLGRPPLGDPKAHFSPAYPPATGLAAWLLGSIETVMW